MSSFVDSAPLTDSDVDGTASVAAAASAAASAANEDAAAAGGVRMRDLWMVAGGVAGVVAWLV